MLNRYGPWATMIDLGGSPQLSTFWRRRLTMLASASRTNIVLSRRSLLWLSAAALLLMALPTIHFAAAGEDGQSPAKGGGVAAKKRSDEASRKSGTASEPHEGGGGTAFGGYVVASEGDEPASGQIHLPVYVMYSHLNLASVRKELKITPSQTDRLREISRACIKREEEARKQIAKELDELPPNDRTPKQSDLWTRLEHLANSDAARKQIEQVLTKEQLTELRSAAIGTWGLTRLLYDEQLRERVDISDSQQKELEQLGEEQHRSSLRLLKLVEPIRQELLAVVTPQQLDKLARDVALNGVAVPQSGIGNTELGQLLSPDVRKQLRLTAEQQTKVLELAAESQRRFSQAPEMQERSPFEDSAGQPPDRQAARERKMAEFARKDHEGIARILSTEQAAALAKIVAQHNLLDALLRSGTLDVKGSAGILRQIDISPDQWKELHRLHEKQGRLLWQYGRDIGEGVLKILTPAQQETFIEEWVRTFMKPIPPPMARKAARR